MLLIALSRNSDERARRYTNSGVTVLERNTINSVEPKATSSSLGKHWTKAVFPFSRQGVIRANSVSPFLNFEPLLPARDSTSVMSMEPVARLVMGTNDFSPSLGTVVVG